MILARNSTDDTAQSKLAQLAGAEPFSTVVSVLLSICREELLPVGCRQVGELKLLLMGRLDRYLA